MQPRSSGEALEMLQHPAKSQMANDLVLLTKRIIGIAPSLGQRTVIFPLMWPRLVVKFSVLRNDMVQVNEAEGNESVQTLVS